MSIERVTYIPRETPAVAALQRRNDDQGRHIVRLETENTDLRRELTRLRAEMAPQAKARWWETALAWLVCRLDAANRRMKHWGL